MVARLEEYVMAHTWNYNGDINLTCGGFYWREDGADDYVLVVRVTPCSDGGGPDNLYLIEQGSLYLPSDPAKRQSALSCIGYGDKPEVTRSMLVDAFMAYGGIDRDTYNGEHVVRIGKPEEATIGGWNPTPDKVLRANASLERYVRKQYLDRA